VQNGGLISLLAQNHNLLQAADENGKDWFSVMLENDFWKFGGVTDISQLSTSYKTNF
jgi:hypothetical protein